MNEREEPAHCSQLPTGVSLASIGSQPWAQPFPWQPETEKQVFLFSSEGHGALVSLPAPRAAVTLTACAAPWVFRDPVQPHFSFLLFAGPACVAAAEQLLEDLECTWDTSALDLNTWTCTRNFPWTFIIPGTIVNSWLGNWANLLELFISQVLFF